jgi:transcription initiation factor TFIIF subunit beta
MYMVGAEYGNMPKCYALNMFTDFVPMGGFSDVNQGCAAAEGKVDHKFDMKPYGETIEEYARLCRERTSKAMVKNRQIQVCFIFSHSGVCFPLLLLYWLLSVRTFLP